MPHTSVPGSTRALVLWANDTSTNLGVRVLAEGAAALVRMDDPGAVVEFHHHGKTDGPARIGRRRDLAREFITRRHGFERWISTFDVVLDTRSGDSFADIYGLRRHTIMSGVAEMTRRAGVPLVLSPQTIGPFHTRVGRVLGRRTLHTAAAVMARDPVSASVSAALGRPVDLQTTDVVFALSEPPEAPGRDVLLNVSGLLWQDGPHVDAARYRRTVEEVYRGLRDRGREVALLAHVLDSPHPDNDVPAARAFAASLEEPVEVLEPASLDEVRSLLRGSRLVIGSRMHACLNGLSVGTPAIAMAYSRKFAPLMSDLGWPGCVDLGGEDDARAVLELVDRDDLHPRAESVRQDGRSRLEAAAQVVGRALRPGS